MNRYSKIVKNTFWFALGSFGSKAISFFMVPLYTKMLSTTDYGKVDMVITTISLIIPIITLQIVDATFRFVMDEKYDKKQVLSASIFVLIMSTIIILFFKPFLNKIYFLKGILKYFYIILILNIFTDVFKQFIKAMNKVFIFALSDILYTFSFVSLNIIFLVYKKYGVYGYFKSYAYAFIIEIVFLIIFGRLYKYFKFKYINRKIIKDMLLYSIPLIPSLLSWWIMNVSDRYVLTFYIGLASTGIYAISNKIPTIINVVNSVFYNSWAISAVEEFNSKDRDIFFTNIFNVNFSIIVLLTSIILVLVKPIYSIWVSKNFYIAWKYTPFLLMGALFASFSNFFGVGYVASKKTKGAFYTSILGAIVNLIIDLIFIPKWGIQVASFSTMAGYFTMWIARVIQTRKYFKINFNFKILFSTFFILGMQILILYSNFRYQLFLNIILFSLNFLINYNYIKQIKYKL